jgi:hypothetical protein
MTETSYRFDERGIYPYACALHPGMSGAIVVGDPADAVAAGTTGDSGATTASGTAGDASSAAAQSSSTPPVGPLALVAAGAITGVVAGAGAVWLAVRRRKTGTQPLVPTD